MFVLLGFVLRLAPLGRYVTPDEPNWVYRSVRFSDAMAVGNWSDIPSTGHPGVTTMWLGAAGVYARRWLSPEESARHLEWIRRLAWLDPENGEACGHLAFFLGGGRIAIALVTSLSLAVLFPLLSCLFDRTVALIVIGLLSFDPFLIGHSGLLHTDALLATFTMLTLVTALNGLRRPHQVLWWPLVGVFGGLALLTKSPAMLVVGFVALLLSVRWIEPLVRGSATPGGRWRPITHGLLFAVSLVITVTVLHPGLWGDPVGVLQRTFFVADRHLTSVQRPVFFAGEMVLDPGAAFYLVVLLFRVSPLVLFGVAMGAVQLGHIPSDRRRVFVLLLLFAFLFGAGITLSTKKHGRYLLPIFPPLALAAALGVDGWSIRHGGWLVDRLRSSVGRVGDLPSRQSLGLLAVLAHAVIALAAAPYSLNHYNPVLGGRAIASRVLATGWGEGWSVAARLLNRLPDAQQLSVAVSSVPPFSPTFKGRTLPLNEDTIALADYVVQDGADDAPAGFRLLESIPIPSRHRPTVVYENLAAAEQTDWLRARVGDNDLILLDADTPLMRRYVGPGELFSTDALPHEAALADWLCEHIPERGNVWLVASRGASPITAEHLRRQVEALASAAETSVVASSTINRFVPQLPCPLTGPDAYQAGFGAQLAFVDGVVPESVEWPQLLEVTLRWQALVDNESDHQALIILRSGDGHSWSSHESLVRNATNFPTSAWRAGEWADATYQLALPPGISPDRYRVEVSVYDSGTGARVGAVDPDGAFQGTRVHVGYAEVAPPGVRPAVAELGIAEAMAVVAGPLRVIGMNPVAEDVLSGDSLPLEVFWQAEMAPDIDHRVRWRLVGPQDEVGMVVELPLSTYPTSRWEPGDRFRAHYDLRVAPSVSPGEWQLMLNVLGEGGDPLWEQDREIGAVGVLPREREFTLPDDIQHRTNFRFGDFIHLRGYRLPQTTVRAGESLPLVLYWKAEGPTDQSYTLFVHLLGPEGELVGQVDRIPGGGAAPTSSWAADQVIAEEISLPVSPDADAGAYGIAVGFYDPAYGGRLLVDMGEGQILSQDQVVLPTQIAVKQ